MIVVSFPHNPTTACVDLAFMQRLVDFALEHEVIVVHDFAYAELGFDGYRPPSILQAKGAKECAVELYSMTKSFSMAGWRVAFMFGNAEVVAALAKLKSYLDYGTFQPIQIAATVTMNEASDYPREVNAIYQGRRDALCDGLARIGWEFPKPKGTMFVWAPIPEPYQEMGSLEFASFLVQGGRCRDLARHRLRRRRRRSSCGSRSSRTSSASTKPSATCARRSRSCDLVAVVRFASASSCSLRSTIGAARTRAAHCAARFDARVTVRSQTFRRVRLMEHYAVRVWLPDRPGALGQVASRIGAVRGDVVGIEILERGAGRAIDELIVALPEPGLVDLLVNEIAQVDGVDVEDVRSISDPTRVARLDALETAARLVEAPDVERAVRGAVHRCDRRLRRRLVRGAAVCPTAR